MAPKNFSQLAIKINPNRSTLKEQTFKFPTTESSQVELAIASELI